MKISVCSDLHLEFGGPDLIFDNKEKADVLVLAGDITLAQFFDDYPGHKKQRDFSRKFFEMCSANFPDVVYIMGNHEHYHSDFSTTPILMREALKGLDNIHFLDKTSWSKDGVKFFGATFWTDMNKEDPITMQAIKHMMNDFVQIRNGSRTFIPEDAVEEHKITLKFLDLNYNLWKKPMVVVGHHLPSHLSVSHNFSGDTIGNGGYRSELSEFILDRPNIKLWVHGHSHVPFDYKIGDTRVYSNPRGYYGHEQRAVDFKLQTVEI